MIFYFTLKFFELFKCFSYVSLSRYTHICLNHLWGQKIMILAACLNTHRTAHISMYDFQQVTCPFHCSKERGFSHLAKEAWFACVKWFKIKWLQKSISMEVLSCALHQYDLSGSATWKWYYHYQLYIFWHQCYEHVYNYDRDSINHSHWVHDHRRYYSCNQNNHYSLTEMNNCIAINMI